MLRDRTWFKRVFNELPSEADSNQKGVAFVGLLFGIAVGAGASGIAEPVIEFFREAAQEKERYGSTRHVTIMHYMVAFALSVTSFLGYYTSTNVPQLRIRFFNFPFAQFCLDVLMVVSYFTLFLFAEGPNDVPDARPEAVLVFGSFVLYAIWDWLSWRLKLDPLSQLALGSMPYKSDRFWRTYQSRRWVTLFLLLTTGLIAGGSFRWEQDSATGVVVIDSLLIAVILAFRLLKSVGDSGIDYRGKPPDDDEPTAVSKPKSGVYRPVAIADWERVVPRAVTLDLAVMEEIGKDGSKSYGVADLSRLDAASRLAQCGAVELSRDDDQTCVSLTKAGRAYLSMHKIAT